MKTFFKAILLIPVIALAVGWAMANRHAVEVSGDVFNMKILPYVTEPLPLYGVVFAAMALGVLIGGVATWFGQRRHRRQAAHQRLEARRLRGEVDRLKAETQAAASGSTALVAR